MSVEEKPLIINISSLSPEGSESDIDAKPRNSGSGCDNVNGIIGSASSECGLRGSQTRVQNIGSPPSLEGLQSGSNSSSNSNSSSSSSSSSSSNDNDVPIPESIFFMYPRPLTKFQRVLVILSVWCVVIVFFVVLFSVFAIVWYLVTKRSILSIVLFAGFLCLCFVPRKVHIWPNYTANKVFQLWAAYFDFAVVSEAKALSPSHKYIFADFPHGIFPAGLFFSQVMNCKMNSSRDSDERNFFGGKNTLIGVADALTHFPLWRQTFGWAGITSASYKNLVDQLVNKNMNIALLPGGIAEMFIHPVKNTESVYLNPRKGFVRLAIETGSYLVPCYYFGQSHILKQLNIPLLAKISRKIRISLFVLIPWVFRHKIVMVMGTPIPVQKKENPTDEDIQNLHALFKSEMIRIFNSYKHLVGWNQYQLVVH